MSTLGTDLFSQKLEFNKAATIESQKYRKLAVLLLILNSVSALFFIGLIKRPVFDDPFNFPDADRYATDGVTVSSIRHHINPTGPTSFIWMALSIRMLKGDRLRDARLSVVFSWLLLGAGVLAGARYTQFAPMWYAAFMVSLAFPHTVTATATVLTEGTAMLFALLGVMAWVESTTRRPMTAGLLLIGTFGGLFLGLSVTCRQYYLALLATAGAAGLYQLRTRKQTEKSLFSLNLILSMAAAMIPVLLLLWIWKGVSSPGMVSGVSYANWKSKIGLNLFRPAVAGFYILLYFIPLTMPASLHVNFRRRELAILFSVLGGCAIASFSSSLLSPGPIRSAIQIANRVSGGGFLLFALITATAIYNAASVGVVFWRKRDELLRCAPFVFALLTVAFFIAEQLGVGGNIPFYELYLLQLAPFLGLIAFALLPRLDVSRLLPLILMSLLSHAILWRYAFIIK